VIQTSNVDHITTTAGQQELNPHQRKPRQKQVTSVKAAELMTVLPVPFILVPLTIGVNAMLIKNQKALL
jgi:hypothetical protein